MYFQSIVFLRAFAALSVCIFHFTCGNPNFLPSTHWFKVMGFFGKYGVDIFFVVSGFVIPYSLAKRSYRRQDFGAFVRRRFWRIELPYLASLALAILIGSLVAIIKKEPFVWSWTQIMAHLFYLNNFLEIKWLVPVYWTLAIEFQYYLWLGLCFPCLFSRHKIARYCTWAVWIGLAYLLPKDLWLFEYVGLFGLGILLCQYHLQYIEKTEFWVGSFACLALIVGKLGVLSAVAGLFAFGCIRLELYAHLFANLPTVIAWVGKISYSLYLTHVLVAGRFIGLVELKTSSISWRIVSVFLAIIIALLVAHIFYILIEKPFHKQSKNNQQPR